LAAIGEGFDKAVRIAVLQEYGAAQHQRVVQQGYGSVIQRSILLKGILVKLAEIPLEPADY
jgi:hypothetical protein